MKSIKEFILEKFKINSKTINQKDKFKEELDQLISKYLSEEFGYQLNREYKVELSEDHNDLLIDFNESLHLSERKLMHIGKDIKQIFKKNWIHCWSEPMLKSSSHNKGNHQINFAL